MACMYVTQTHYWRVLCLAGCDDAVQRAAAAATTPNPPVLLWRREPAAAAAMAGSALDTLRHEMQVLLQPRSSSSSSLKNHHGKSAESPAVQHAAKPPVGAPPPLANCSARHKCLPTSTASLERSKRTTTATATPHLLQLLQPAYIPPSPHHQRAQAPVQRGGRCAPDRRAKRQTV